MPNTYTQLHIHAVFAVRNRKCLIEKSWKDELYKYITGIIQNNNHKLIQINGMPDHVHILFGMRPVQSLSDLMKQVKQHSSVWINERKLTREKFYWQSGYAAFACSKSHISNAATYIQNQEEHHRKKSFTEEYRDLLDEFEVEYDERYLFNPVL